ncbi:MAG: 50S ribosomal protein L17 [Magnetococcales bacterium]|nr:50S ribosomal protein L17 [Magnetococcales bacterium]
MRHRESGRKLNRNGAQRKILFAQLLRSLVKYDRIEITLPRAKELRGEADRLVTLGKRGDLESRRAAFQILQDKDLVYRLFSVVAERSKARQGGYTRVLKTGFRYGDCAPMSIIEFVDREAAQ